MSEDWFMGKQDAKKFSFLLSVTLELEGFFSTSISVPTAQLWISGCLETRLRIQEGKIHSWFFWYFKFWSSPICLLLFKKTWGFLAASVGENMLTYVLSGAGILAAGILHLFFPCLKCFSPRSLANSYLDFKF